MDRPRPTPQQLQQARSRTVPDIIAPGLKVLFCGINPGLYSGAVGHHFARPGNRFWPALHLGGFTPRLLSPYEELELLPLGLGITNLVPRTTATADELTPDELVAAAGPLEAKIRRFRPAWVAVLGIGAYRDAFAVRKVALGPQDRTIGPSRLWVLPNPSGLNAHHRLEDLGRLMADLRRAAG